MAQRSFKIGDLVVYPSHGVGTIRAIEQQVLTVGTLEVYVIIFQEAKLKLHIPVGRAHAAGLRPLSSHETMTGALSFLSDKGTLIRNRVWIRRAQEYETKINTGDPRNLAFVLRALYTDNEEDQSFSERRLFRTAFMRFVKELAAVEQMPESLASKKVETLLRQH